MIRLSRRQLALALLSLGASSQSALPQAPRDQGIGGTGAVPKPPTGGDRGIGGTGVIGTIRRFGSIYVNDLRIAYTPSATVFIDGARARTSDMKIGHVVQTIASGAETALVANRIEIASEVIGTVDRIVPNGLIVLGQSVDLRGVQQRNFKIGAFVAVFGQRRPNGVIVASLIEPRPPGRTKIAGPLAVDGSGRVSIGGLALRGVPSGLAGSRVSVEGELRGDVYGVSRLRNLARPFGPEVGRMSIEGFLAPAGGRLGSGLVVSGAAQRASGGAALVIVSGRVSRSGELIAGAVRQDTSVQIPEFGGPTVRPLSAPDLLPGLGGTGGLPGGSAPLLPAQPGGLLPSTPNLGLPGGGGLLRR
ncbi:MAG: hypothetical protein JWN07_2148 [Hyphomicrobiales bacterium]|nr:hypothetical protein [Hyphomicrobiales bacterium]